MLKKLYLSPLGYFISLVQNLLAVFHQPFMVYGYYNWVQKRFMRLTRISSSAKIMHTSGLDINDNVWIGHYTLLDASSGIKIGIGVQTGPFVSIFTHSSHVSIRLLGDSYITSNNRTGYIQAPVSIGEYTFIGTGAMIYPGVEIGKGCFIKAGSIVTKSLPDYAIAAGNPATIIGNTYEYDEKYFTDPEIQNTYYDQNIIKAWKLKSIKEKQNVESTTI